MTAIELIHHRFDWEIIPGVPKDDTDSKDKDNS